MRKSLFFCFLIMIFYLLGFNAFASEYKSEVKVGLRYGEAALESVVVSSGGGVAVFDASTGDWLYSSAYGEELLIKKEASGFSSDSKFYAGEITKISVQPQNGATIFCDGKEYRGYIFLERQSNGNMTVMNIVGTDYYVASVLGKEMSYTWPKEALKAQAVCARNFVLCRGSSHKNYGFDVCTTTHCQVYGGVKSEHENTLQAVNETKGILATYNGKTVPLYFFATSGGMTEDVENVWGSPYGYLKSVKDTYENPDKASKYTWSVKLSRSEIEAKLVNAGINIGRLLALSVDETTASGRVTKLTFKGSTGSHTAKLEKSRSILGLYSQKFTVMPENALSVSTTSGNATGPYYVISLSGVSLAAGLKAITSDGSIVSVSAPSSAIENYIISGGGYGHGVGMSQWGARGMAENGFKYDEILKHYFTGIVLE